jgi:hypothetical protein
MLFSQHPHAKGACEEALLTGDLLRAVIAPLLEIPAERENRTACALLMRRPFSYLRLIAPIDAVPNRVRGVCCNKTKGPQRSLLGTAVDLYPLCRRVQVFSF